jgi:hypothetical protein
MLSSARESLASRRSPMLRSAPCRDHDAYQMALKRVLRDLLSMAV